MVSCSLRDIEAIWFGAGGFNSSKMRTAAGGGRYPSTACSAYSKGESPAWGERGFLGKHGSGDRRASKSVSLAFAKRFKTTTPPERNMFARRRCRRTGCAIPQ